MAATRTREDSLEPREEFLDFKMESEKAVLSAGVEWSGCTEEHGLSLPCGCEQGEEEVRSNAAEHSRHGPSLLAISSSFPGAGRPDTCFQ